MNKNKITKVVLLLGFIYVATIGSAGCSPNKTDTEQKELEFKENQSVENNRIKYPEQNYNVIDSPEQNETVIVTPEAVAVNTVLASFSTKLLDRDKNRISNIRLASKKINNYVLKPGKQFSFNKIVGDRVSKNGYKKAIIIIDGEKEEGIGGGICQLSSTIYNAAQRAGMKIVERHSHTKEVYYVPEGSDAAVDYRNLDMRFVNTKNYSVKFRILIKKGNLYVSILRV